MMARVLALMFGVLALAACSSDDTTRDDSGEIVEGGELGVFVVREGDCVNIPIDEQLTSFEGVACDEPHDGQAFGLFDVVGFDEYPGPEAVSNQAQEGCLERFETFIGIDYEESIYYIQNINPSEDSWDQLDDREIVCMVVPNDGEPQLTQDLRGVAE